MLSLHCTSGKAGAMVDPVCISIRWVSSATTSLGRAMTSCFVGGEASLGNSVGAARITLPAGFCVPAPVRRDKPSTMPSSLPEFLPSACAKASILEIASVNALELSERIDWICVKAPRAAVVQSMPASAPASSVGSPPSGAAGGGAEAVPPVRAISGTPVRPPKTRPTLVSARIGVSVATAIVTSTPAGSSGTSFRSVTSPTRMPLNCTGAPRRSPETDCSKRTR